jgi:hypothetical protein
MITAERGVAMNLLGDERGPSHGGEGEMTFSNIAGVLPAADKVIYFHLFTFEYVQSYTSVWFYVSKRLYFIFT